MNVEIISKDTEKLYDNHGCSWGEEYRVKFKVNDKLFIAEYSETGLKSDVYYVSIYLAPTDNSKFLFASDRVTAVKFLTSPNYMTSSAFADTLGELLMQDKNFQEYLPEEDRLKKVAEEVFGMNSDY